MEEIVFAAGPYFIGIVFLIVFVVIIFTVIKGITQWQKNERSPRISVPVTVKTKRTDVRRHANHNDNLVSHSTSTSYYVTFEFESGDRSEFHISGSEYGQLAEGDSGILTFQGTRYLGFERRVEHQA